MVTTNNRSTKDLWGSNKGGERFVKFPSWVLDAPSVNASTQSVYLVLIDYTSKGQDVVWPSVATIARRAKVGTTAARQSLRQLEALGMIATETQPSHGSNRYTIVELSAADIARIQGVDENALTSGDAKLRGSDLGATPRVDPPTPRVDPPTPRVARATPAVDEPEPGKKNQGTRTNNQNQERRAGGAERPDQEIEMTQEPKTEDETGLHARLQRIAAGNKISAAVTDALVEKLRGAKNDDPDLQFTTLDTLGTEDQPLGEHKFRTLWSTPEAQRDLAKKRQERQHLDETTGYEDALQAPGETKDHPPVDGLADDNDSPAGFKSGWGFQVISLDDERQKRQKPLVAAGSAGATQGHQDEQIVAQESAQPRESAPSHADDETLLAEARRKVEEQRARMAEAQVAEARQFQETLEEYYRTERASAR